MHVLALSLHDTLRRPELDSTNASSFVIDSPMTSTRQSRAATPETVLSSLPSHLHGLQVPADALRDIQQDYIRQASEIWSQSLTDPKALPLADRRFNAEAWRHSPMGAYMAAMYLLNAQTLKRMAGAMEGEERLKERVNFSLSQWIDAASPANFLALNPEAQQLAVDTRGQSLAQGVGHLVHDIMQGHMSQTDESVFKVGENLAVTPGSVVFENDFFQLIEYAPTTPKVHTVPFLMVPPCINKFYILDLTPENSLVRYLVSQGHRVFMVSWANADESLAKATWDDYTEQGVFKAIETVQAITRAPQINALGFCIGGTLLAAGLASLAARGQHPVASLTLLTSFLDFSNTGIMDVLVDEALVSMREMTMGAQSPQGGGLMKGSDLATTFSFLRPNDLVWNYVVANYLKGQTPPPFDLLYWNSDSTNLPGPMYCWYLRNTYLENRMKDPGATTVCGQPVDLRKLTMPTFIYGSREDHIVPWESAYASTQLLTGPKTFVLGASGHIAGVINPPEKHKRSFWAAPATTATTRARNAKAKSSSQVFPDAQTWLAQAQEQPGSWWPTWAAWLAQQAGPLVKAPSSPGSKQFPPIEAAPGRYVKKRA